MRNWITFLACVTILGSACGGGGTTTVPDTTATDTTSPDTTSPDTTATDTTSPDTTATDTTATDTTSSDTTATDTTVTDTTSSDTTAGDVTTPDTTPADTVQGPSCAEDNGGCGDAQYYSCTDTDSGVSCADIDECLTDNGGCGSDICVNNDGGFDCKKGLLELCTDAAICHDLAGSGGHCAPMTVDGQSRCTKTCSANSECPQGTRCQNKEGQSLCLDDDVGRPCTTEDPCNFGCLLNPTAPQYCTTACNSGADCPNGYGCTSIESIKVCVRAEGFCTSASECTQGCDLSPSMLIGGCTTQCETALDCPQRAAPFQPWQCQNGSCTRPEDINGSLEGGYSPVEYHCNASQQAVNLCNDAFVIDYTNFTIPETPAVDCGSNMTTTGTPSSSCLNSCRFQGGCSHGHACVSIGSVNGQPIGLCMPKGIIEIGAACENHIDCDFGYCFEGICSRDCTVDGLCPGDLNCGPVGGLMVEGLTFKRCMP